MSLPRGERLIPIDAEVPRGWRLQGRIETEEGPRRLIIFWRRQKRLDHQVSRDLARGSISAKTS